MTPRTASKERLAKIKPDISHDALPEAYGEAMGLCQMYAPACSDIGECQLDGFCFGRNGQGYAEARRQIDALIGDEKNVFTRSWLRLALDAIDHHQFTGRKAMDALRLIAINKTVREMYDAKPAGRRAIEEGGPSDGSN